MKTYQVTLICHIPAKSKKRAYAKLGKAIEAAMKVAPAGVGMEAREVTDE